MRFTLEKQRSNFNIFALSILEGKTKEPKSFQNVTWNVVNYFRPKTQNYKILYQWKFTYFFCLCIFFTVIMLQVEATRSSYQVGIEVMENWPYEQAGNTPGKALGTVWPKTYRAHPRTMHTNWSAELLLIHTTHTIGFNFHLMDTILNFFYEINLSKSFTVYFKFPLCILNLSTEVFSGLHCVPFLLISFSPYLWAHHLQTTIAYIFARYQYLSDINYTPGSRVFPCRIWNTLLWST